MNPTVLRPMAVAALLACAGAAQALGVSDPVGDYVPGYAGSQAGDLDVIGAFVTYNQTTDTFVLSGTMQADIGTTPGGLYVWGVNRGAGTARFATSGITGVLFDAVVIFNQDGSGTVNRIVGGSATQLAAGTAKVVGSTIIGSFSGALLPSLGFAKTDYTWNLWPRDGKLPAGFGQISDFAPDNSNFVNTTISPVPEPASLTLLGLGAAALLARRRRQMA